MKKLYLIQTGATFDELTAKHGDMDAWFLRGLAPYTAQVVAPFRGDALPDPETVLGAVITGAHCMVTDRLEWSEETAAWIRALHALSVPMLGVCYGHQLIADALGGKAGFHPAGIEVGTAEITLTDAASDDPLFAKMPRTFPAHVAHSQSAVSLPPDAVLLATGTHEPHHSFRAGKHAWGVQFHPDFTAELTREYVKRSGKKLAERGLTVEEALVTVCETPDSETLLRRFAEYCQK